MLGFRVWGSDLFGVFCDPHILQGAQGPPLLMVSNGNGWGCCMVFWELEVPLALQVDLS